MLAMYLSVLETQEERDRFEEIYNLYRGSMGKIAFDILQNKEDTEDAVNDAFMCIANRFKKISTFSRQELKSYLIIIIRNASYKVYNDNRKWGGIGKDIDDTEISVNIDFLSNMEYESLIAIMDELPVIYRDVLYLCYRDELTTKEIAKLLGISETTVYKRIERAKKLLAVALENGGYYG